MTERGGTYDRPWRVRGRYGNGLGLVRFTYGNGSGMDRDSSENGPVKVRKVQGKFS